MKQAFKSLMLASLFALTTNLSANAGAAELKVGYVQVDKILQDAPQTAESGKKLEREFSPRSLDLDKMQKQIRDIEAADRKSVV